MDSLGKQKADMMRLHPRGKDALGSYQRSGEPTEDWQNSGLHPMIVCLTQMPNVVFTPR